MGRPKKKQTAKETDINTGIVIEVEDVGVPGLFQPGESDIREELEGNEALWQHQRENNFDSI